MIDQLKAEYESFALLSKNLVPRLQTCLKDQTLPLEDRWSLYERVHESLPTKGFGDGDVETLNKKFKLYDYFYISRYETLPYAVILERVLEDKLEVDAESMMVWKETILQAGYGSFTYDW